MKQRISLVALFIFILILMFVLFPKSCQQASGSPFPGTRQLQVTSVGE
ncbi:MAG: hypothetical protein ONB44_20540 [candidate division KSB1 bacterium]|nr:hypothetical protein [candidate division KSB1 bacterium]MDZ7304520.1 hypothetical protein [candidate division KSB1 bacterium]MDZ7313900.1 hypothetical protein [candidate division KSB1 bacterium]